MLYLSTCKSGPKPYLSGPKPYLSGPKPYLWARN